MLLSIYFVKISIKMREEKKKNQFLLGEILKVTKNNIRIFLGIDIKLFNLQKHIEILPHINDNI